MTLHNNSNDMQALISRATTNVGNIIKSAIELSPEKNALVVYDEEFGLTDILVSAYRAALPDAKFVNFNTTDKSEIIKMFDSMEAGDLVVLIQSTNFLLNEFRIRLHLFEKKLKVIEHLHLTRNSEEIWDVYIDSLEYDRSYYRVIGPQLQQVLANCKTLKVVSGDATLIVENGLEYPKLNIGDYSGMENIGGTFPIGEVFTEARDFANVNGELYIYAYAGSDFKVGKYAPFKIRIENGIVKSWDNAPESKIKQYRKVFSYATSINQPQRVLDFKALMK
jgi:hypothetical protein